MSKCEKPYTISYIGDIDIDDLATIPDYFIGTRAVEDIATGDTIYTPVRVPGARVMPTGNLANVTAIATNNHDLVVPENQVRAGYIDLQPTGNIMRPAGTSNAAQFLMIKNYAINKMLIQSTGFLTFPEPHQYIVSSQYYLGEDGEPVTDNTVTGQKLFIPLDEYTIMINGEF